MTSLRSTRSTLGTSRRRIPPAPRSPWPGCRRARWSRSRPSRVPKVLHPLAGRPMLTHVLDSLAAAGIEHRVVVTGSGADAVESALGDVPTVRQEPQLGTADAVRC